MKRVLIIINPISGRKFKHNVLNKISSYINMKKYDVTIRFTSHAGHATKLASNAVRDGVDIVVAVGGDGTVNEVAQSLINTQTVLGIIPCGSGNGLARHLNIPMNIRKAVNIINEGTASAIDSLIVNGKPCFCTAGVGYDAIVSAAFARVSRRGLITYIKKTLCGFFRYKPEEYTLETDTQVIKRRAFLVTCANANQWGNEFHVAPNASLKDGLIDVTIIHPIKLIYTLAMPVQILGYSFDKNPNVECFKTRKLTIKRQIADWGHIDGEPVMLDTEINVSVCRENLKVLISTKHDNI